MKTLEDYQKAIAEIKEVCKKHNVALLGTCAAEGIYGEISIMDSNDRNSCDWAVSQGDLDSTIYNNDGIFHLLGIGSVNYKVQ